MLEIIIKKVGIECWGYKSRSKENEKMEIQVFLVCLF